MNIEDRKEYYAKIEREFDEWLDDPATHWLDDKDAAWQAWNERQEDVDRLTAQLTSINNCDLSLLREMRDHIAQDIESPSGDLEADYVNDARLLVAKFDAMISGVFLKPFVREKIHTGLLCWHVFEDGSQCTNKVAGANLFCHEHALDQQED